MGLYSQENRSTFVLPGDTGCYHLYGIFKNFHYEWYPGQDCVPVFRPISTRLIVQPFFCHFSSKTTHLDTLYRLIRIAFRSPKSHRFIQNFVLLEFYLCLHLLHLNTGSTSKLTSNSLGPWGGYHGTLQN